MSSRHERFWDAINRYVLSCAVADIEAILKETGAMPREPESHQRTMKPHTGVKQWTPEETAAFTRIARTKGEGK